MQFTELNEFRVKSWFVSGGHDQKSETGYGAEEKSVRISSLLLPRIYMKRLESGV